MSTREQLGSYIMFDILNDLYDISDSGPPPVEK